MATGSVLAEELEVYRRRTPRSAALREAARAVLPGGNNRSSIFLQPYPVYVTEGSGFRLTDLDGNAYIDFGNNYTAAILGHAHPAVVAALTAQARRGASFAAPTAAEVTLARLLCERVPSLEQVRFTNSGTEATLMACRAARAFTGRSAIAKFEGGYHGSHEHAEVSVAPSLDRAGPPDAPAAVPSNAAIPEGVLRDVLVLPYNNAEASVRLIQANRDRLAGVIVEPVLGAAGMIPAKPEFLRALRGVTEECGILLIFDEVISFRVGPGGAQGLTGIRPDLTTLGKVIGGGLPVGAFGGRADIMALFDPSEGSPRVAHAGTFNGNPMTLEAGAATLRELTPALYERLGALGHRLRLGAQKALEEAGLTACVTGIESLFSLHFAPPPVTDYRAAARGDREDLHAAVVMLLNRGIMLVPKGSGCISTPMGEAEVDTFLAAFREVCGLLAAG
ncbi:MAG: aspartate aminotransferase family protein [candidate division NC10 bacterium]|nr:aspartate aminotransferase family protein [candidate division NC10 bacterium]